MVATTDVYALIRDIEVSRSRESLNTTFQAIYILLFVLERELVA